MTLQLDLKSKALIKKSKQLNIQRGATPFADIKNVLLIWDANQSKTDIEELKTFGHEMRKSGKNITMLTFYPLKKLGADMQPNEIYKLCCKGDFSMFATPKSKNLKDILSVQYDLLINGCLNDNEYLKTIAVFSKAKFRIGPFLENEDTNFYELLIRPNGADPCENYLIEIGRSLRKIQ